MKRIALILAGGKGERFWPLTRIATPKQLLPLTSTNPMIVETYNRLAGFDAFFVIANQTLCDAFRPILPPTARYIMEPEPRNTAPAIGLACAEIFRTYGDCIIFIETADHFYANPQLYLDDANLACNFAEKSDRIILIGIQPTWAHTGYGYIQIGDPFEGPFFHVAAFKEKPDRSTAQSYLLTGKYVWNAGVYVGKSSVFLEEIHTYLPRLGDFLDFIRNNAADPKEIAEKFHQTENISIDYGVYEKSGRLAVMKSGMPWEDIGDFNSLKHVLQCDLQGNFLKTESLPIAALDSNDNIIISEKKVALIGIKDVAIIETPDVLLICKRSDTQKIKNLLPLVEDQYR
jgi:mannose-1-phosphate guanylyltransferase